MRTLVILIFFAGCIIGLACNKKDNSNVYGPYTIQSIFSNMAVNPKTVTINANAGGSVFGNSGARYFFPPYSFVRDSVQIIGDVQVQVAEYITKSDMIFSSILPISNGSPVITAGSYYINVLQSGKPVVITHPTKYTVNIPQKKTPLPGMQLFLGRPNDTVATNLINWQQNYDTSIGGIIYNGDSITIISDSVHYCAASRFMTSPLAYQNITITVSAPITTFSDTIMAYALYDTMNVAWQMLNIKNHIISDSMVTNDAMHIIVFTVITGDFYCGILAITPIAGKNYNIYLTKSSPVLFKSKIDAL